MNTDVTNLKDQKLSPYFAPSSQKHRAALAALTPSERELATEALSVSLDFMPNPLFNKADAQRELFDEGMEIARAGTGWYHPMMEDVLTSATPSSSLLKANEEKHLFLRYNYARMRAGILAAAFKEKPGKKTATELAFWFGRVRDTRELITNANLALVLAMAKRTRMADVDFGDLISEGNMALLRAVEKFDAARGFKFSTYACRAILKAFSRIAVKSNRYHTMFPMEFDPSMERSKDMETRRDNVTRDAVEELQRIIRANSANLTEVERRVIEARFAINRTQEETSMTLEEVGQVIGVTKERVRQIQNRALEKLRATLNSEVLV